MNSTREKKRRQTISLPVKLEILRRIDHGQRQSQVIRDLDLPGSTIRTIIKSRERILKKARNAAEESKSSKAELEKQLKTWVKDSEQSGVFVTPEMIQNKARDLHEELNLKGTFSVTDRWLQKFKKRIHFKTENEEENIIPIAPLSNFDLDNYIREAIHAGGYLPDQVFNAIETDLYWKITGPDLNVFNNHVTLLLGANASGGMKLKPLMVYHHPNPKCLKGYVKNRLPVLFKSNNRAVMTRIIFQSWFTEYFCPVVERYLSKALLIISQSAGHPNNLDDLSSCVKVIQVPANFEHPMNMGAVALFKSFYIQKTIGSLERYNIRKGIELIADAWNELDSDTLANMWNKLWNNILVTQHEEALESVQLNIIEMVKQNGFEINVDDIQSVIQRTLTCEMDQETDEDDEGDDIEDEGEEDEKTKNLTVSAMAKAFEHLDEFYAYFQDNDPDMERSWAVRTKIEEQIQCYRQLYQEKTKALTSMLPQSSSDVEPGVLKRERP